MSRRRSNHLQVNTFPFLAVLLCAMGSLILVLLVMDRRSKLAAQARAQEQIRQQTDQHHQAIAARRQEHEKKKRAVKSAWEKKRADLTARVNSEQTALEGELREVQAQLASAARRLREQEEKVAGLQQQLTQERDRVALQQKSLHSAQKQASDLDRQRTEADKARTRLAGDLVKLEQTVRDLQAARQRDAETFSVIPYHGKHGDSRRPIYIECSARGLVFHPDQKQLPAEQTESVREEVQRRVQQQKERPYLLLLVRPDGIEVYYQLQAAVRDLGVDFGYEFVNADWKFHFPKDGAPSRTTKMASGPSAPPIRTTPTGSSPVQVLTPLPGGSGKGGGPGVTLSAPTPFGRAPGTGVLTPGLPVTARPDSPQAAPGGGQSAPAGIGTPVLLPELARPSTIPPAAGATGAGKRVVGDRRPAVLRPAQISNIGEVTIYIECREDVVVIYPSGRRISIDALTHSPAYNPLHQLIRQLIARRQDVPAGQPRPRVQLCFLVHRDGERTYHLAYPVLEAMPATQVRRNLDSSDDVARIVAGQ